MSDETPEVWEDPSPLSTSNFLKIARAVDGDDLWNMRLSMAMEIFGLENTRTNKVLITTEVADSIECTVVGTVDTNGVTDAQIVAAINKLLASQAPKAEDDPNYDIDPEFQGE